MKYITEIYNSKMDKYGNCYWAFKVTNVENKKSILARGDAYSNISYAVRKLDIDTYITEKEMPIREFNRFTKGMVYGGCGSDDVAKFIKERIG